MDFELPKWFRTSGRQRIQSSPRKDLVLVVESLERRRLLTTSPQGVFEPSTEHDGQIIEYAPLDAEAHSCPKVFLTGSLNGGGEMHFSGEDWWWQSGDQTLTFKLAPAYNTVLDAQLPNGDHATFHSVTVHPSNPGQPDQASLRDPGDTQEHFHMYGTDFSVSPNRDLKVIVTLDHPYLSLQDFQADCFQAGPPPLRDTDGDGTPDLQDSDDDNDDTPDGDDVDDDNDGVQDPMDIDHPDGLMGKYDPGEGDVGTATTGNGGEIGDQVALSGQNGSVDIHGVPIPQPSPTGEGESDRVPNMAKIDAFSLTPSFSTTDIAVPLPGDELLMEFRRTLSTDTKVIHPYNPVIDFRWAAETIMGPAWSTNLNSHVMLSYSSQHSADEPTYRATVYDEVGTPVSYASDDGATFTPDVKSSFSNAALKGTLESDVTYDSQTYDLAYTKEHGTRLFFSLVSSVSRGTGLINPTDYYYRLDRIVDRNGNEIRYTYSTFDSTLVQSIYDPSIINPDPETPEETYSRRIDFGYTFFNSIGPSGEWRLTGATDPLGRTFNYTYDMTGLMTSVLKPDPEVGRAGNPVRPTVSFTYTGQIQIKAYIKSNSQGIVYNGLEWELFTLPLTITDARNNVTTFDYTDYWTPTGIRSEGSARIFLYQNRPLISSVNTVDGTAYFHPVTRTEFQEVTEVTDTRGVTTTYTFGSGSSDQLVEAPNSLGWAIALDQMKREVDVTDVDDNTTTKSVTFKYSRDINGNLTEVDDMSGNVLLYEYDSEDGNDDYNDKPFGNDYGTRYQIFGQPSKRIMADGELNLTTEYRYDVNFNKLIEEIDPEGKVTTYTLDGNGNRTAVIAANGSDVETTTIYVYDGNGFMTSQTDPDGRVTEYVPNEFGNLGTTIVKGYASEDLTPLDDNTEWLTSERDADVMDRTLASTDPLGHTTSYEYDNWDRLIETTMPLVEDPTANTDGDPLSGDAVAPTTSKIYDFNSNVIQETDANGNVTLHVYDAMNRQTSSRLRMVSPTADNALDIVQSTTYDAVGLVDTQTDAMGRVTDHDYDALLREIRTTLPTVTVVATPGSTSATPTTTTQQYVTKAYYGDNSGSGAFTLGGFNPTRVINARGYATDTVYDDAYRAISVIRRHDSGSTIDSTDAARSDEPETDTLYNKDGKPIEVTVRNKTRSGTSVNRTTYTFYDDLMRPTFTAVDMDGDGVGSDPATTIVNYPATFSAQNDDLVAITQYDGAGHTISTTDAENRTTQTVYDGAGRAIETHLPMVDLYSPDEGQLSDQLPVTTIVYDASSNPILSTDANGNPTLTEYDALNRPVRTILDLDGDDAFDSTQSASADDIVTVTGYDLNGNKLYSIDPNGNRSNTEYDNANRATAVQGPAVADAEDSDTLTHPLTTTEYDKNGNVLTVTDPRGIETETQYDELNRARFVIAHSNSIIGSPDRLVTESRYDANGNKVALVLFNVVGSSTLPQVTTYAYDAFDRQTSETLPSIGDSHTRQTTTVYNLASQPLTVTDAKDQDVETDYDRAGRATETRFYRTNNTLEETRTSAYDKVGNLTIRTDLNGTSGYTYDAMNRQVAETRENTTSGIEDEYTLYNHYDANGNRTAVNYPNGRNVDSYYDRANRLVAAADDHSQFVSFAYDSAGNRINEGQSNGTSITSTFDAMNRVQTFYAQRASDPVIYNLTYKYDLAGQRRSAVEKLIGQPERDLTWDYDGLYRLIAEEWTGPKAQTNNYGYDAAGNRLSLETTVADGSRLFEYDALNQLVATTNKDSSAQYEYDLNGNRVTKWFNDGQTNYAYDTSDRLISATNASTEEQIFAATYDARTRRVSKTEGSTTTIFRYDGGTNFQELQDTNDDDVVEVQKELIRAGGLGGGIGSVLYTTNAVGKSDYFIYDALGNTVALTDDGGKPTQTTLYDAFGQAIVQTATGVWKPAGYPNTIEVAVSNSDHTDGGYTLRWDEQRQGYGSDGDLVLVTKDGDSGWKVEITDEEVEFNFTWDGTTRGLNVDATAEEVTARNSGDLTNNAERPSQGWVEPSAFPDSVDLVVHQTGQDDEHYLLTWDDIAECYIGHDDTELFDAQLMLQSGSQWGLGIYDADSHGLTLNWDGSTRQFEVDLDTDAVTARNSQPTTNNTERPGALWRPASYPKSVTISVVNSPSGADVPDGDYTLLWDDVYGGYFLHQLGDGLLISGGSLPNAAVTFLADASASESFAWDGSTRGLVLDGTGGEAAHGLEGYVVTKAANDGPLFGNTERPTDNAPANNRLHNTKERDASIGLDNHGFRYYDPETATYIQRDPSGYSDGLNVYQSVHDNPINGVDPLGLETDSDGVVVPPSWMGGHYNPLYFAATYLAHKVNSYYDVKESVQALGSLSDQRADPSVIWPSNSNQAGFQPQQQQAMANSFGQLGRGLSGTIDAVPGMSATPLLLGGTSSSVESLTIGTATRAETAAITGIAKDEQRALQVIESQSKRDMQAADAALNGGNAAGIAPDANAIARGRASETRVLTDLGEQKNTAILRTDEGNTIPDFQNTTQIGEIKDAKTVTNTAQIRAQKAAAAASERTHVIVTGNNTHVSENASNGSQVVRRDDLGPPSK